MEFRYNYQHSQDIACEGQPYEIADKENTYKKANHDSEYYRTPLARDFEYQDPVKHLAKKEAYTHMQKHQPIKPKVQFPSRDVYKYDYRVSAWDRLISKTPKEHIICKNSKNAHQKQTKKISNRIFNASDLPVASKGYCTKSIRTKIDCMDENCNILNKQHFQVSYTPQEFSKPFEKPSKKFNHPYGKSRYDFKIIDHNPQKSERVCIPKQNDTTRSELKSILEQRASLANMPCSAAVEDNQKGSSRTSFPHNKHGPNPIVFEQPENVDDVKERQRSSSFWVPKKPEQKASKKMYKPLNHTSQIVLGDGCSYHESSRGRSQCDTKHTKPSGLKRPRASTAKGRKPQQIRSAFQSQISLS